MGPSLHAMLRAAALALALAATAAAQDATRLVVTAVDDSTGAVVPGAVVSIANGGQRAVADAAGRAALALPAGLYVVQVTADGYDPVTFTATLGGAEVAGEVGLVPAARRLGEVVTTAERPRADLARVGFYDRREEGRGEFLDREDLARGGTPSLAQALVGLSGVRVRRWTDRETGQTRTVATTSREGMGPNGMRDNAPCPLTIYKDGIKISAGGTFDVTSVGTSDLAGLELYPGPATTPQEYRQFSPCGVLLLWTRIE